jgi:hypothetical protein
MPSIEASTTHDQGLQAWDIPHGGAILGNGPRPPWPTRHGGAGRARHGEALQGIETILIYTPHQVALGCQTRRGPARD